MLKKFRIDRIKLDLTSSIKLDLGSLESNLSDSTNQTTYWSFDNISDIDGFELESYKRRSEKYRRDKSEILNQTNEEEIIENVHITTLQPSENCKFYLI